MAFSSGISVELLEKKIIDALVASRGIIVFPTDQRCIVFETMIKAKFSEDDSEFTTEFRTPVLPDEIASGNRVYVTVYNKVCCVLCMDDSIHIVYVPNMHYILDRKFSECTVGT